MRSLGPQSGYDENELYQLQLELQRALDARAAAEAQLQAALRESAHLKELLNSLAKTDAVGPAPQETSAEGLAVPAGYATLPKDMKQRVKVAVKRPTPLAEGALTQVMARGGSHLLCWSLTRVLWRGAGGGRRAAVALHALERLPARHRVPSSPARCAEQAQQRYAHGGRTADPASAAQAHAAVPLAGVAAAGEGGGCQLARARTRSQLAASDVGGGHVPDRVELVSKARHQL